MITGHPQQCNLTLDIGLRDIKEGNGGLRIPCFIGLNQTLLSAEINGSIVGLLAAFIDDGNFDALISLPQT